MKLINNNRLVYTIVAVFTVIQFAIMLVFGPTLYYDSDCYIYFAKDCVAHGEPYPVASEIGSYDFIWNVGSINIVALSLFLFHTVTPLYFIYAILKGLSALLLYKITCHQFDGRVGFTALLLYVLYPANYGESTSFLSELPFIFFILSGIWLALNRKKTIAGGILIAIANWIRPMGLVFIAAMAVYYLVARQWKNIAKIVVGFAIMIVIIGSLTWYRTGYFIYQAKTGWMALLQYSVDTSADNDAWYTDAKGFNSVQKDSLWQKRMAAWIVDHPKDYVAQMPIKLAKTYISDNPNFCAFMPDKNNSDYMYNEVSMPTLINSFPHYTWVQWLTAYNLVYYYALMVLFVIGCVSLIRRRRWTDVAMPLGVVFFGTAILLFFGHGEARFHIPFMPFIIMIDACWLQYRLLKRAQNQTLTRK